MSYFVLPFNAIDHLYLCMENSKRSTFIRHRKCHWNAHSTERIIDDFGFHSNLLDISEIYFEHYESGLNILSPFDTLLVKFSTISWDKNWFVVFLFFVN